MNSKKIDSKKLEAECGKKIVGELILRKKMEKNIEKKMILETEIEKRKKNRKRKINMEVREERSEK